MVAILGLGVLAGILTTVGGMGGGVMLVLVLSVMWDDPVRAMIVTTPALLVGNVHRLWRFRAHLDRRFAFPFVAGALPASVLGAALSLTLPKVIVQVAMVLTATLAVLHALGWLRLHPPRAALVPAGALVGLATSTSGGGGFLAGTVLLASGLSGPAYLATMSFSSLSMHCGKLLSYGLGGRLDAPTLALSAALAVAITIGNRLGEALRRHTTERWAHGLEVGLAVGMVALAIAGLV